jgi:nucleoid-associated protein YgaU
MGCVHQAVLEFDEEIQAPWRPRLVSVPDADEATTARSLRPHPSRHSPSRVGVCAPTPAPGRPVAPVRRVSSRPGRSGEAAMPAVRPGSGRGPALRRGKAVRLRLTRRARRLAVVLALAAGVALGSWLGPLLAGGNGELRLAGESSVIVQSGDTLWSIATSLDGEGDVRALVDEIQRLNGLTGADLVPGQVLQLP